MPNKDLLEIGINKVKIPQEVYKDSLKPLAKRVGNIGDTLGEEL
jgi:hypothetical protein